ncbi:hypothetical protein E4U42_000550, partial [Claviceps africana]
MPPDAPALSPEQTTALLDILSHHETHREITSFTSPDTIAGYGFPFDDDDDDDASTPAGSTAPILQLLLRRLLPMPGLRDLPRAFWAHVRTLLARLAGADLSSSYDKGSLGTRRVLAAGSSVVLGGVAGGLLGGVVAGGEEDEDGAGDLEGAWGVVLHLFPFHNSDHTNPSLAALMHHILVLSPKGPYLLKLMENVHSLIPYKMIRQTLRVGNAATMINTVTRILLAKLSVTSVTNWFGLTRSDDDGMNLVQRIIALVLSWDASEFRKSADKIERASASAGAGARARAAGRHDADADADDDAAAAAAADDDNPPTEEMLRVIRAYIEEPSSHHDVVRSASERNGQSIMTEIFNASNPHLNARLTEAQHAQCLQYYSSLLSIRDRDRITDVFCRQPPDVFTRALKDLVAAFSPMIRTIHANIDLRDHFDATQAFVEDFIKTSRPKEGADHFSTEERMDDDDNKEGREQEQETKASTSPSVQDYVALLMRHRRSLYRWLHALASQCPDIWESFRVWTDETLVQFRKNEDGRASVPAVLGRLYAGLDPDTQTEVRAALDRHVAYLSALHLVSRARMRDLAAA